MMDIQTFRNYLRELIENESLPTTQKPMPTIEQNHFAIGDHVQLTDDFEGAPKGLTGIVKCTAHENQIFIDFAPNNFSGHTGGSWCHGELNTNTGYYVHIEYLEKINTNIKKQHDLYPLKYLAETEASLS